MLLPIFTSIWAVEHLCWFSEPLFAHPAPACPDCSHHGRAHTQSTNSGVFQLPAPFPYPKTSLSHDPSISPSVQPSLCMFLSSTLPSHSIQLSQTSQERFAPCRHLTGFGWVPVSHGLSFVLCGVQRQEDTAYSHIRNPSPASFEYWDSSGPCLHFWAFHLLS